MSQDHTTKFPNRRVARRDLDWQAIEDDYKAGESIHRLASKYEVARQSIQHRIKTYDWQRMTGTVDTRNDTIAKHADDVLAVQKAEVQDAQRKHKVRTRQLAELLELAERGATFSIMASHIGMTRANLDEWMKRSPTLRRKIEQRLAAYAMARLDNMTVAANKGDTTAARHWLSKHPMTREDWSDGGDGSGQGNGITVVLNIGDPAEKPATIDITPARAAIEDAHTKDL